MFGKQTKSEVTVVTRIQFKTKHTLLNLYNPLAEGIAVAPNGSLYLLDKYGTVFQSHSATSPLQRVTHLGAGRPLGFDFDESGNLFICNTPTVRFHLDAATCQDTKTNFALYFDAVSHDRSLSSPSLLWQMDY